MGWPATSVQNSGGKSFGFSYTYNDAGGLLTSTYPSGRVVTYERDGRNRVTKVKNGATTYASEMVYAAHGALAELKLGALYESVSFNGRLQPETRRVGTVAGGEYQGSDVLQLTLAYGVAGANNGNVTSQQIQIPGVLNRLQNYGYDGMNRLQMVDEWQVGGAEQWRWDYGYKEPGNAYVSAWRGLAPEAFTPVGAANFDAKNRLLIQGSSYGLSGNQNGIGGYTFTWDGEGRLLTSAINGVTTTHGTTARGGGCGRRVRRGRWITFTMPVGSWWRSMGGRGRRSRCSLCLWTIWGRRGCWRRRMGR
jgi:YD repeat-containing protein